MEIYYCWRGPGHKERLIFRYTSLQLRKRSWESQSRRPGGRAKLCLYLHMQPPDITLRTPNPPPPWLWPSVSLWLGHIRYIVVALKQTNKKETHLVLLLSFQPTDLYFMGSRRANGSHPKRELKKRCPLLKHFHFSSSQELNVLSSTDLPS